MNWHAFLFSLSCLFVVVCALFFENGQQCVGNAFVAISIATGIATVTKYTEYVDAKKRSGQY